MALVASGAGPAVVMYPPGLGVRIPSTRCARLGYPFVSFLVSQADCWFAIFQTVGLFMAWTKTWRGPVALSLACTLAKPYG